MSDLRGIRVALLPAALAALVLLTAGAAEAAVNAFWRELGGSASGGGVSRVGPGNTASSASVALGPDGRPVVAYSEAPEGGPNGTIVVKRWTGSAWQTLSPAGGVGAPGSDVQISIAPDGTIYVAWVALDGDVHLRLRRPTGTAWEELSYSGGPGGLTSVGFVLAFSLAVAADGTPFVAFTAFARTGVGLGTDGILSGSTQAYVLVHRGTGWQYLGSSPFAGGEGASNARSLSVRGGAFYALHAVDGEVRGSQGVQGIRLAIDSAGRPVLAFRYVTRYLSGAWPPEFVPNDATGLRRDIYVTRFDDVSSTWTPVGPAVPQVDDGGPARGAPGGVTATPDAIFEFAFAAAPAGDRLYLAWSSDQNFGTIRVRRWNGLDPWQELNGSDGASGIGRGFLPAVAVDGDGNAIVAWTFSQELIYALRSNSLDEFEEMGTGSASLDGIHREAVGRRVRAPSIAHLDGATTTPAATAVVAWMSVQTGTPSQVFLRQFTEGPAFPLHVAVTPADNGRVVSDPIGIDCRDSCSALFPRGQAVRLTPIDDPGSLFDGWLGACTGTGACTVSMTAARNVSARFTAAPTLTVDRTGPGTVSGPGIACGADCEQKYRRGTLVTLTVTPLSGARFDGWGGACAFRGQNTSCALPLDSGDRSVSARFSRPFHVVTLAAAVPAGAPSNSQNDRVTGSRDGIQFLNCGPGNSGSCRNDFIQGDRLVLRALPGSGNRFLNWAGGPCAGRTNATCEFTLVAAVTTTALFQGATAITVGKTDSGAARGAVTGPGIACDPDCTGEVLTGTRVTLTQVAGAANRFVDWTGPCENPLAAACTFLASGANQTVGARFRLNRHRLSVVVEGSGAGHVRSEPAGILCGNSGTDCAEDHDDGTLVALTPAAVAPDVFSGWSGCPRLNGSVCLVDMRANRTVTARFVQSRSVFLQLFGRGQGRITSSVTPAIPSAPGCLYDGIDLVLCRERLNFPGGSTVVLTGKPEPGTQFAWSAPAECATGTTCTVRLNDASATLEGGFILPVHTLTVTPRPNGSVVGTAVGRQFTHAIECAEGLSNPACSAGSDAGSLVSLQAVPNPGQVFTRWSGTAPCSVGARATNASCSFPLFSSVTATPSFRPRTVVSVRKRGAGDGTVTGPGLSCGTDCTETLFDGKSVTLVATPRPGSRVTFLGFITCEPNAPSCSLSFVPSGDSRTLDVFFELQPYTVTIASRNQGVVTSFDRHPDLVTCGTGETDCASTRLFGTPVGLHATALDGFVFDRWTGDALCAGKTSPVCEFRVPARNVSVAPSYRPRTQVTVVKQGNGAGLVTGPGITCGLDCTEPVFDGRRVTLVATPAVGSEAAGFGDACVSSTTTCAFTPAGDDQTVTAAFTLRRFTVTVAPNANGSVVSRGALTDPIACGAHCLARLDFGTLVTLDASPGPLHVFGKWTGTVCNGSTNRTCSFRIGLANVSVAPGYRQANEIHIEKSGNGSGAVVSTPAGLTCLAGFNDCLATFFDGKPVTLRATPSIGSRFEGFASGCVSSGPTCTFTPVGAHVDVSARFTLLRFTLTVARRAEGLVTTVGTPGSPIACGAGGAACVNVFDHGRLRLRATPQPGFAFTSWTGVACAGGNTAAECEFTLAANTSVTPSYRRRTLVSVLRLGTGTGTVTGSGIACGADCSENVFDGRALTVTATPAAGSRFLGWGLACAAAGSASACTFTPTGDAETVTARFERQPQAVTINVSGSGLVRRPGGDCLPGQACRVEGLFGDTVELTAVPQGINRLLAWTGCTSVAGNVCRVLLNANKSVTARLSVALTVQTSPAGVGSVTGPGINCGTDCTETYAPGTVVTLTRVLGLAVGFRGWEDACAARGMNATCTLTLNADTVVGAEFDPR